MSTRKQLGRHIRGKRPEKQSVLSSRRPQNIRRQDREGARCPLPRIRIFAILFAKLFSFHLARKGGGPNCRYRSTPWALRAENSSQPRGWPPYSVDEIPPWLVASTPATSRRCDAWSLCNPTRVKSHGLLLNYQRGISRLITHRRVLRGQILTQLPGGQFGRGSLGRIATP